LLAFNCKRVNNGISRDTLIDTIEDKEIYSQLQKFNVKIDIVKAANLRHEQLRDILEAMKKSEDK
jgi:autonomous glycyl radical cofactor GrcA